MDRRRSQRQGSGGSDDLGGGLRDGGHALDIAHPGAWRRSYRWIVLDEMDLMWIPVERNWRLNERLRRCRG